MCVFLEHGFVKGLTQTAKAVQMLFEDEFMFIL